MIVQKQLKICNRHGMITPKEGRDDGRVTDEERIGYLDFVTEHPSKLELGQKIEDQSKAQIHSYLSFLSVC